MGHGWVSRCLRLTEQRMEGRRGDTHRKQWVGGASKNVSAEIPRELQEKSRQTPGKRGPALR